MEKVELRLSRKPLTIILIFVLVIMLGSLIYFFVFTTDVSWSFTEYWYIIASFILGVTILNYVRLFKGNIPVLVFEESQITYNKAHSSVVINLVEVSKIEVKHVADDGYFLEIETKNQNYSININWLDQTPENITRIIKNY